MLVAVLRMPPQLWVESPFDKRQRHSRYLEAADRIENDAAEIDRLREEINDLKDMIPSYLKTCIRLALRPLELDEERLDVIVKEVMKSESIVMNTEYVDADGWPTEAALQRIMDWPTDDLHNMFKFIHDIWWAPEWGWEEETTERYRAYHISTGGWSGNEDIIDVLHRKPKFWSLSLSAYRRGGHYTFDDVYWRFFK
jgi:hypothetical protein